MGTGIAIMGCGSIADDTVTDASTDSADAGHEAGSDVGADTGHDATTDSPSDDASEAGDDATTEAGDDGAAEAGDDASSDAPSNDGGQPDASVVCGSKMGFGYVSVGDGGPTPCGVGEDYQCGNDSYEILCECPAQLCTCKKNNAQVGMASFGGCPSCSSPSFANIASSCGVPY